jgi:hypothetical protein
MAAARVIESSEKQQVLLHFILEDAAQRKFAHDAPPQSGHFKQMFFATHHSFFAVVRFGSSGARLLSRHASR